MIFEIEGQVHYPQRFCDRDIAWRTISDRLVGRRTACQAVSDRQPSDFGAINTLWIIFTVNRRSKFKIKDQGKIDENFSSS